jgi:hypothetical protein
VTCSNSVVFYRCSSFFHQWKWLSRSNRNIVEKGIKYPSNMHWLYIYNRKTKSMISSTQTSDSKVWCIKKIVVTQSICLILYHNWNIFKNLELKYSFFYHVKLYNKINIYLSYKQSRTLTKIITFYLWLTRTITLYLNVRTNKI